MLITLWYCFIFSEWPVVVFITYIEICLQDFMSNSYAFLYGIAHVWIISSVKLKTILKGIQVDSLVSLV